MKKLLLIIAALLILTPNAYSTIAESIDVNNLTVYVKATFLGTTDFKGGTFTTATATKFIGSGEGLTNLPANQLKGVLPFSVMYNSFLGVDTTVNSTWTFNNPTVFLSSVTAGSICLNSVCNDTWDHNNLTSIQGGSIGEYYHLTKSQHDNILYSTDTAGGDISGPFAALIVADDSHNHTAATLFGVRVATIAINSADVDTSILISTRAVPNAIIDLSTTVGVSTRYAGIVSSPTITDNGNGTVTLGAGVYNLYSDSTTTTTMYQYTHPGGTFSISSTTANYIILKYQAGTTPLMYWTSNVDEINLRSEIIVLTAGRIGSAISYLNWDSYGNAIPEKLMERFVRTERFSRELTGGLELSESATPVERTVLISSANIWLGDLRLSIPAFNSSSNPLYYFHHVAGNWVYDVVTQYPNTYYDDGASTQTLSNNKYTLAWIYSDIGMTAKAYLLLGTAQYNSVAAAELATEPINKPFTISATGHLVGRIIFQKSATSGIVESVFTKAFAAGVVANHNDLSSLQGGQTGEYYHFTKTQHDEVIYTTNTVYDMMSSSAIISHNAGVLEPANIVDAAGSAISISSSTVLIRDNANWTGQLYYKYVAANTGLAVTDNAVNFIYITWNSGSPTYGATTDRTVINNSNYVPVARVYMSGGNISYQLLNGNLGLDLTVQGYDRVMRIRGQQGFEKESGLAVSCSSTSPNISSGYVFFGYHRMALSAYNVATLNNMWIYTHSGGVWIETNSASINNTYYDNGTSTATLTAGRYAINYLFRRVNETVNELDIVVGTGDYTLAQAQAAVGVIPNTPQSFTYFYYPVGAIIIQRGATTPTQVVTYNPSSGVTFATAVEHGDLLGLGDDNHLQYLLLTGRGGQSINDNIFVTGSFESSTSVKAPQLCIGADCRTSWPTGGTGTGTGNVWTTSGGDAKHLPMFDVGISTIEDSGIDATTLRTTSTAITSADVDSTIRITSVAITGADVNADILLSTNPAIVKEGQVNTFGTYEQYMPTIIGYLHSESPYMHGLLLSGGGLGSTSRLILNSEDDPDYPTKIELFSANMTNLSDVTGMYTVYKSSHVWGEWSDATRSYRYSFLNGAMTVSGGINPASVNLSTTASKSSDNNFSATQTFQYGLATSTASFSSTATFNSPAQFNGVATSTPAVTNALYKANITGAWAYFNGTTSPPTLTSGFNISGLTKTGTGDYRVYFANDFAAGNAFVCLCGTGRAEATDYGDCLVQGLSQPGFIDVATYDNAATKTDRARVSILCVGAQ